MIHAEDGEKYIILQLPIISLFDEIIKVLKQQKELGVKGITTVLGPPVHTFPPLFRQTGPYSRFELSLVKDLDFTYCLAYEV